MHTYLAKIPRSIFLLRNKISKILPLQQLTRCGTPVRICMYVCMYVCVYVCKYCLFNSSPAVGRLYAYVCMYVCMHVCVYVNIASSTAHRL